MVGLVSRGGLWGWLASWVHEGRFRPDYVPSGVVTGRWAARGGGALQLPAHSNKALPGSSEAAMQSAMQAQAVSA